MNRQRRRDESASLRTFDRKGGVGILLIFRGKEGRMEILQG